MKGLERGNEATIFVMSGFWVGRESGNQIRGRLILVRNNECLRTALCHRNETQATPRILNDWINTYMHIRVCVFLTVEHYWRETKKNPVIFMLNVYTHKHNTYTKLVLIYR